MSRCWGKSKTTVNAWFLAQESFTMTRRPIRLGPVGATIIGAILEREFQYDPILGSRFWISIIHSYISSFFYNRTTRTDRIRLFLRIIGSLSSSFLNKRVNMKVCKRKPRITTSITICPSLSFTRPLEPRYVSWYPTHANRNAFRRQLLWIRFVPHTRFLGLTI